MEICSTDMYYLKKTSFWGKESAVIGLDMKICKGEIYGFLGTNGSGEDRSVPFVRS